MSIRLLKKSLAPRYRYWLSTSCTATGRCAPPPPRRHARHAVNYPGDKLSVGYAGDTCPQVGGGRAACLACPRSSLRHYKSRPPRWSAPIRGIGAALTPYCPRTRDEPMPPIKPRAATRRARRRRAKPSARRRQSSRSSTSQWRSYDPVLRLRLYRLSPARKR